MTHPQDFISELAAKLGRSTPTNPPELVPINLPMYQLPNQEERTAIFLQNWQALGGKGTVVKSTEDIIQALKNWFSEPSVDLLRNQAIVAWDALPEIVEAAFTSLNWSLTRYSQAAANPRDRYLLAAQAELGVTGADLGVALSGTLVIKSEPHRGRTVSLLPPRHLAFIEASKLRDNLFEVLDELSEIGDALPAAIEFITGPSRTSDIEMDLSIGVHGPIEVYVLIIED
ncbi:LUD domain-containing protein [Desulfosporosinus sp. Sb-LF]|uniref:LutC/YkgG family protein n=1 Tax=Desulfosporosinus sp. Sb-LF TaxID=2560027 RepID=UPI00107F3B9B|nr:LUD domain-containing protein [Desulfosporosinus sp. Sb-LF]TGE31161.1 lactate utilization protein C [Desulfosporosinus sp. Sb-LF]